MTLSLYLTIQQIIMGCILALGTQLIFEKMPGKLNGSRFEKSARIIGLAVVIIPIASFIYYFSALRYAGAQFATAINLSAYCLMSTLVAMACCTLLDVIHNKPIIKAHLAVGFLFPIPMWISLYFGSETICRHVLIASYTTFCVLVIIHITTSLHFYFQKVKNRSTDESQLQKIEFKILNRIMRVYCGLATVSLLSPAIFSYPIWLGVIFIITFLSGSLYIYISYHKLISRNIISLLQPISSSPKHTKDDTKEICDESEVKIGTEIKSHIEKQIVSWINKKEFRKPDISINYVAKEICTNRTYLSRYINTTYDCSFKNWVTRLRIEDAKMAMLDYPTLSISAIAELTGFASGESFSHIFTRHEQISPSKWREDNNLTVG